MKGLDLGCGREGNFMKQKLPNVGHGPVVLATSSEL